MSNEMPNMNNVRYNLRLIEKIPPKLANTWFVAEMMEGSGFVLNFAYLSQGEAQSSEQDLDTGITPVEPEHVSSVFLPKRRFLEFVSELNTIASKMQDK